MMQFFYAALSITVLIIALQPILWIIGIALYTLGAIMRKEKFWD